MVYNKNFNTAIFYTCGTCNLQCRYCNIYKNPILKEIDDALEESFKGDYYFNRVREYFPKKYMLTNFETWGGEPFIHMDRLHYTLRKLIEYYPYLKNGYSSTNFSYPQWCDQFFGLMDIFGEYPDRDFSYCLQLSVDGPLNLNDAGRGNGTTEKCINNFNKLIDLLKQDRLPANINLTVTLKGTLDLNTMKTLQTEDDIIAYYKFYEDTFIDKIKKLNLPNVFIIYGIPNTAVPSPVTVEDGKFFAGLVKKCRHIEERQRDGEHIFDYYECITPFNGDIIQDNLTYKYGYHTCGTGNVSIGFLPNNMVSTCHEGFVQIAEEYSKLAADDTTRADKGTINFDKFASSATRSMCVNDDQYEHNHYYIMELYNTNNASARLATHTAAIIALALAGQVDQIYIDEENALKAAIFIQSHTAYCIKDNYNITGSYGLVPLGEFKLLLNGAMQYIQNDAELHAFNKFIYQGDCLC